MKIYPHLIKYVAAAMALAGLAAPLQAAVTLPSSAALPTNSVSNPGFVVRSAQASIIDTVANSYLRATRQINSILTDNANNVITNVAIPGPEVGGAYFAQYVSFERDAFVVEPVDDTGTLVGTAFNSDFFPGIPGYEGDTTQFADESVGLVVLEPGTYRLAICANADRTDVNDDDGVAVFVGANPRDAFATKILDFHRTTGTAAFSGNQHIENTIDVVVPVLGAYPFRLLHWQQTRNANLQFYVVNTNTGGRSLINDGTSFGAPLAYRSSTNSDYNSPYIADIVPSAGSAGNGSQTPLTITLIDGYSNTVNTASAQLSINSLVVTPTKLKVGSKTTIAYLPAGGWTTANNSVSLVYSDSGAISHSNGWSFGVNVAGGSTTQVKGQWDFDNGNLNATVGNALTYFDPTFDGPTGTNANKTQFGTTTSFGISDINGQIANVMRVPGDLTRKIGYVMTHGIAPNGGGTRVNQYTLIMDVLVDTTGPGAASLLQISDPISNADDGDLFWQGNNFGQGAGGYNGTGQFTAGAWHRVVAAYDEAANPPVVTKYVDGIKQDDWTANQGLDAARRALLPTAILFGDGDGPNAVQSADERRIMWVNSIQIRAGKLSDAEMVALGGPEACGIPATIPQSTVSGQWDFERGDLSPTIGKALKYFDPTFDGPTGTNANLTTFGTCSGLGVSLINGVDAKIIQVPGDLTRKIGYVMTHGIAPNGGGTKVNQYTIAFDIMVNNTGPGAASLLQISDPISNADDGDLFWQGNNFGQGAGGYNGTGAFTPLAWHRVVAAYDEAATPPVVTKYVDGIKQDDWTANQGLDAARRALQPTAILFGDGDGPNAVQSADERRIMWVKSIQIRSGKLSDADIVQLGAPTGSAIPVVLNHSTVAGQWDFNRSNLVATVGKALAYFDPTFDGPTGTNANLTTFGKCSDLGVALINGSDENIVQVPGDLTRKIGYVMTHGIAANGGGTKVNQYTIAFDIMVNNTGPGAASLLQISDPISNADDGDLFWQGNNFGQGAGGYNGTGAFTPLAWHRVVAAYNEAAVPPVVTKYVDGVFQDDWTANQGLDAVRRALQPTAILFGDGDGPNAVQSADERRIMWVNSIQIRDGALSKKELAALSTPSAGGLPMISPVIPDVKLCWGRIGTGLTLIWPLSATGWTLDSAPAITGPWTPVPGVVNNSIVVSTTGPGNKYFRLRR